MKDLIVIKANHSFSVKAEDIFNVFIKKENDIKWMKLLGDVKSCRDKPCNRR